MELGSKNIGITMLCLGPVFSSVAVNAFTGKIGEKSPVAHESNAHRMDTSRAAYLMAVATINRLDEAWITIQPVLTLHYFNQYLPAVARKLMPRFMTVERMNKLREGKWMIKEYEMAILAHLYYLLLLLDQTLLKKL